MADLRSDVEQLKNDLSGTTHEIMDKVAAFARARPHVAVGAALGIGWVLGNGLHPRLAMSATQLAYKALVGGALVGGGFLQALGVEQGVEHDEVKRTSRAPTSSGARRATSEGEASSRKGSASRE